MGDTSNTIAEHRNPTQPTPSNSMPSLIQSTRCKSSLSFRAFGCTSQPEVTLPSLIKSSATWEDTQMKKNKKKKHSKQQILVEDCIGVQDLWCADASAAASVDCVRPLPPSRPKIDLHKFHHRERPSYSSRQRANAEPYTSMGLDIPPIGPHVFEARYYHHLRNRSPEALAEMVLPIAVEDVKREVEILKALAGHENVVQFHNAFEDENYVYIVMELCEGGELLDRILAKKDSRYTEKDAAVVVRQMLRVAAQCHLHGLVHRDMKPENFLFKSTEEDSSLKAADFGLSDFIKPGRKFKDIVGSAYYVAPEVLKRKSGPEADVWSIGVITYILLCGRRPFWDKTEDGIFKEVLQNKPDFQHKPWPTISDDAKDFVKKLLVKDPRARFTASQALSHLWVREGGNASDIPVDISVLRNMRQFVKYSRMKQVALRALAGTLNEDELANLRDQFDAIDVDKSGTISLEEIRQALAKNLPWKLKDSRVLEIVKAMDSNTDGLVDFSEFVAATLHVHQLQDGEKWQQVSQAAFEKFDLDKDGYITPEELRLHTGLKGSMDPLLEKADIDKDGKISLAEFRKLLKSESMSSRKTASPLQKNLRTL